MLGRKSKKKNQDETYVPNVPIIEDDLIGIGSSTDFKGALKEMFSDDFLEKKTDLTPKQIRKLNLVKGMATYYGVPILDYLYNNFLNLRVSNARKGRDEGVRMTQQIGTFKRMEALESQLRSGHK